MYRIIEISIELEIYPSTKPFNMECACRYCILVQRVFTVVLSCTDRVILIFFDFSHDLDTQEFEEFLQKVRQTTYPGGPASKSLTFNKYKTFSVLI